jgi:Bacterial capsule synthesis protein PGA_cap
MLPSDIYVPLRQQLDAVAQTTTGGDQLRLSVDAGSAVVKVSAAGAAADVALITRTLAVAAAFPTVADGLQLADLQRFWAGDPTALAGITNDNSAPTLFLDADTRAALVLLLGAPAESPNIVLLQPQEVLSKTWESRNAAFAILPFEKLDVRYKLLWVNGINLFEREADMSQYPLALRVRLSGDPAVVERLRAAIKPADNRELAKLAVVALTGVTALVRGTAVRMEEKGITYPGEKIRDWLATADIAHISNEVSFWDKCRKPSRTDGVVMCSSPKYMELLRYVGTDIVELTGNHTWDFGADKLVPTIELYEKEGWKIFGGGRNLEESRKPALLTINGNKIAFIGCSYFGSNWATDVYPGATPCGVSDPQAFDWIIPAIRQLKADGYLVIATLQYTEFYSYVATKQQDSDFRALRDAGAVVVNGSQGHHVQGFDVNENGFCHYGTGNLFFGDQTFSRGAQQTMVDRHVFYDGRYIGVDLRTAFIENISQPVPLGPEARAQLLKTLFEASGYK